MATVNVINVWNKNGIVFAAGWIAEGAPWGTVEYICSTPAADAKGNPFAPDQIKAALLAQLAQMRTEQLGSPEPVTGYNGPTTF